MSGWSCCMILIANKCNRVSISSCTMRQSHGVDTNVSSRNCLSNSCFKSLPITWIINRVCKGYCWTTRVEELIITLRIDNQRSVCSRVISSSKCSVSISSAIDDCCQSSRISVVSESCNRTSNCIARSNTNNIISCTQASSTATSISCICSEFWLCSDAARNSR